MAEYCDACETKLGNGKSKCCNADVWLELRAMSRRRICKECNEECEIKGR